VQPDLLIADEPTTALDVTIQAQILELIERCSASYGSAVILITHDLGVVAEIADDVVVMYAGGSSSRAGGRRGLREPQHPYTWGLLGSIPRSTARAERLARSRAAAVAARAARGLPRSTRAAPTRFRLPRAAAARRRAHVAGSRARALPGARRRRGAEGARSPRRGAGDAA
jgi:peptide/nickel transport system ATP-binding protein